MDRGEENKGIELYKTHKEEVTRHIISDIVKMFGAEEVLKSVILQLYINTIEDKEIHYEDRCDFVCATIDDAINDVIGWAAP